MIRRTAEVREKLLRDFAAGCQSAAEFCRSHGINVQTFSYWRKHHVPLDSSTSLVPAPLFRQIRPEPESSSNPAALTLDIGKVRIAVDARFDSVLLRRVVEALS